jgi:hypothetical protein
MNLAITNLSNYIISIVYAENLNLVVVGSNGGKIYILDSLRLQILIYFIT